MEQSKFEQLKPHLTQFILSNEKPRDVVVECMKNLAEFVESTELPAYQKKGYPLGKSWKGFKKWQIREMRKRSN